MKKKELQELVDKALELCLEYDEVGTDLFQREFNVNLITANKIFYKLKEMGIINIDKVVFELYGLSAEVEKGKVKKYFQN